jgi:Tol biopolymer transport system component
VMVKHASGDLTTVCDQLDCFDPVWLPDGKSIVYAREDLGAEVQGLFRVSADGTTTTTVYAGNAGAISPCIARDGHTVFFQTVLDNAPWDAIARVDGTSAATVVITGARHPRCQP